MIAYDIYPSFDGTATADDYFGGTTTTTTHDWSGWNNERTWVTYITTSEPALKVEKEFYWWYEYFIKFKNPRRLTLTRCVERPPFNRNFYTVWPNAPDKENTMKKRYAAWGRDKSFRYKFMRDIYMWFKRLKKRHAF